MRADHIIIKPVITEKTTDLATKNVYVFHVHEDANKYQVAEYISKIYNVTVDSVKISNRKGKVKRVGKKMLPKRFPTVKLAYVEVKNGTINAFPQM